MSISNLTRAELEATVAMLDARLRHLLQSKTVALFDEKDPLTGQYKRDIKRLDTYGVHYKVQEYERTGKVPPSNTTILKVEMSDLEKADRLMKRIGRRLTLLRPDIDLIADMLDMFNKIRVLQPEPEPQKLTTAKWVRSKGGAPPTTGSSVQKSVDKAALWEINLKALQAGAFGDPCDYETMLRYWRAQEDAGYPGARENVQYFTDHKPQVHWSRPGPCPVKITPEQFDAIYNDDKEGL